MKFIIKLESDSDNSFPEEAELEVFETNRGDFVSIKLQGPAREIWIAKKDLGKILDL